MVIFHNRARGRLHIQHQLLVNHGCLIVRMLAVLWKMLFPQNESEIEREEEFTTATQPMRGFCCLSISWAHQIPWNLLLTHMDSSSGVHILMSTPPVLRRCAAHDPGLPRSSMPCVLRRSENRAKAWAKASALSGGWF